MATLTVWKFPDADAAERATQTLASLQSQSLIKVQDEAIITWPHDKKKPRTIQEHNLVGTGALGGGFWGLLFGLIFFIPLIGAAVGAAVGALSASMADVGIDDNFIKRVRAESPREPPHFLCCPRMPSRTASLSHSRRPIPTPP
jgi:uncharacterized membrane protein